MNEIELEYPIEINKKDGLVKRITKVSIRRIKAKDLKLFPKEMLDAETATKKIDVVKLIPLIASLCDLTTDEAGEIDLAGDLTKIVDAIKANMPGESLPSV
jgi:PBP1b-binding outer membrane lipoprotein LpoB